MDHNIVLILNLINSFICYLFGGFWVCIQRRIVYKKIIVTTFWFPNDIGIVFNPPTLISFQKFADNMFLHGIIQRNCSGTFPFGIIT